jgi:hypothetical protein
MKMPLAWHEEYLRNHEALHREKEKAYMRANRDLENSYAQLQFHRDQVAAAKARGLEAFDPVKFIVPRKKK